MQFKDVSRGKWLRKKYLEYIVMASFYYFLIGVSDFRLMTHRYTGLSIVWNSLFLVGF